MATRRRLGRRTATGRGLGRRARLAILVVVATALVLGGAWTWFRTSSFVSVEHVTISGQTGPDAAQISSALESAARTMSTLDVQIGRLRRAAAAFPIVKDVRVSTQFPHGMRITVVEQLAVGAVDADGRRIAVAADGTLLHDVVVSPSLPAIPLSVSPTGTRLTGNTGLQEVKLLAAAPPRLRPKISQVTNVSQHGLVAQMRDGPSIYFGDTSRLEAKWIAASEVLADPGSVGALYIDVTDPDRPAAGAGTQSSSATDTGTQSSSATVAGTQSSSATADAGTASSGTAAVAGTSPVTAASGG